MNRSSRVPVAAHCALALCGAGIPGASNQALANTSGPFLSIDDFKAGNVAPVASCSTIRAATDRQ